MPLSSMGNLDRPVISFARCRGRRCSAQALVVSSWLPIITSLLLSGSPLSTPEGQTTNECGVAESPPSVRLRPCHCRAGTCTVAEGAMGARARTWHHPLLRSPFKSRHFPIGAAMKHFDWHPPARYRVGSSSAGPVIHDARHPSRKRRAGLALRAGFALLAGLLLGAGAAVSAVGRGDSPRVAETTAWQLQERPPVVDARAFHGHGDLAFVSLGGLYVLDGSDDKVVQVVPVGGGASDPQFSPNGKWLTFSAPGCVSCFHLAHGDGSGARVVPLRGSGRVAWLADGRLLAGNDVYRVGATGRLTTLGHVPVALVAWSAGWDEFAFETSDVKTAKDGAFRGKWVLELAPSLSARPALWYQSPISFDPASGKGFQGDQFAGAVVLPGHGGVAFWVDPGNSADHGTLPLYWLKRPSATPVALGPVLPSAVSVGKNGMFAVATGAGKYQWTGKQVEICQVSSGSCSEVRTPPGELSLDPAWSPRDAVLALVEADAGQVPALVARTFGPTEQPLLVKWYATRHLFLLHAGSDVPVEVPGTKGAAAPVWSVNGQGLAYVADNSLWLLPHVGSTPVKVASPLLLPSDWGARYGEVDWSADFAWSNAVPAGPRP